MRDDFPRPAVERKVISIGDALSRSKRLNPGLANAVPDLRDIIAFRYILAHDYTDIDQHRVRRIMESDLPERSRP